MTYDELKTRIADYLNRSDLGSVIDSFIDQTESEINRKLRHKDMIKRSTAVLDNQYSQLPGDWLGAINVDLQTGDPVPLFQKSLESLDLYRNSIQNTSGQPKYFAIDGDTLEVCPTPDQSYTIQMTYYAEIPALSSTVSENFLSRTAPDVYLYGALKHASVYLMEDERIQFFAGQFEKALEELRIQQQQGAFGKGSLLVRKRTYGGKTKPQYYYKS
tara:strand:- start:137 stop:784 length:648 start_codon:yes stop_codon:yes gene_type:complete